MQQVSTRVNPTMQVLNLCLKVKGKENRNKTGGINPLKEEQTLTEVEDLDLIC